MVAGVGVGAGVHSAFDGAGAEHRAVAEAKPER